MEMTDSPMKNVLERLDTLEVQQDQVVSDMKKTHESEMEVLRKRLVKAKTIVHLAKDADKKKVIDMNKIDAAVKAAQSAAKQSEDDLKTLKDTAVKE